MSSSAGILPPSASTHALTASPAPLRRRRPPMSTPLIRVSAVNGTKVACGSAQLALADAVPLLGEDHDRAALGGLVGERRELRDLGELLLGHARHRDELEGLAVAERDRAGLVEEQDVDVAGGLDGAARRGRGRCGGRGGPCPAIPIADSSAPIVVGISAISSATRVTTEASVSANSANGRRVTTTARKISVSPASRMLRAISFGVFRRAAPSTRAIIRSRKLPPGSWVISTTIRSLSTRVPPVTALRSPPDSRITGADSPVIADSSTEAMPSMTVPSPGMPSPASTTTTSPGLSSEAARSVPSSEPGDRLGPRRAQRVGLGLAAALGQRLGDVAEDDGEPEPDRDREAEPGRLVAAAERGAAEELDQPGDRRDHGARPRPRT